MSDAIDRATRLTPGTYRLTADVVNPSPDRRANQARRTSWESWAVWPTGSTFIVEASPDWPAIQRAYMRGGFSSKAISMADRKAWDALTAVMVPVAELPSDYIERTGHGLELHYAMSILDRLNLPIEHVRKLMEEIDNEDMDEVPS